MRLLAASVAPKAVRAVYRRIRDSRELFHDDVKLLYRETAQRYLAMKRTLRHQATGHRSDTYQKGHARNFTSGLLSFVDNSDVLI